jgi:PASTA domain
MTEPFAITTPSASIPMADARHGQATFSVANVSGRRLRGRASVVPREGARPEWFAVGGSAEREFSPGGLEQYTVEIAIPPEAPPGTYGFRLDMLGVDDPDELQSHGEWVSFKAGPVAQPRRLPWLWIAIAVGVVAALILGGAVAFAVTRPTPGPTPTPTAPATATPTPTPTPRPTPTPTPSTVAVPNLIDVRDDQVRSILQAAGLVLISDTGVPDPVCNHPNLVASQSPPPGAVVPIGSGVSVTHGVPPPICP